MRDAGIPRVDHLHPRDFAVAAAAARHDLNICLTAADYILVRQGTLAKL
jgi:hypothetical protein